MKLPAEGGCICGAVRYRLTREPLALYACHCTDCQRQTGSAFGMSMIVDTEGLELLRGDPPLYEHDFPDGRQWRERFCPGCATRLWGEPLRIPQVRVLRPGALDVRAALVPDAHSWTRSRQTWVVIPDGVRRFEGQPTDEELLEVMQERKARARRA